ncbi:SIMPL domain-containing protein [Actinoplanes sp. CA-131856]
MNRFAVSSLVVMASLLLGAPAAAAEREGVVVSGTGEVYGRPDLLTAEFGVESNAATVDAALDTAGTAATRMRDALVRAGLGTDDLQTSNATISARTNDKQEITGYTVSQGLSAKIRDLPKAGALLSAAVAAGGNASRLNGVSFSIEDDAALMAEARRKAFADARGKAELYAGAAGRKLGRVVQVSESAPSWGGGPMAQDSMAASAARFVVEPGRQRLSATVTVEWAFQKA